MSTDMKGFLLILVTVVPLYVIGRMVAATLDLNQDPVASLIVGLLTVAPVVLVGLVSRLVGELYEDWRLRG